MNYLKKYRNFIILTFLSSFFYFFKKRNKKFKKILINFEGSFNLDLCYRNDLFFLNIKKQKLILGAKNKASKEYTKLLKNNNIIDLDQNFNIYNFSTEVNKRIDKDFFEKKNSQN